MPKYRMEAAHYVREYIVLDVDAESIDIIENSKDKIYEAACELVDWQVDYDAGVNEGRAFLLDSNEPGGASYDTPPDATLSLENGEVTVVDAGGPTKKEKIRAVLEKHAARCLDNEEERTAILNDLLELMA